MKKYIETLICLSLAVVSGKALGDEAKLPFEQGKEITDTQMPAGYNLPARVHTMSGWDTFVNASFLYWNVFQEGMDIGPLADTFGAGADSAQNRNTLEFPDEYKSGFKVGLGWNTPYDDWVISLDYTWFHHNIHQKQPASIFLNSNFYGLIFESSSHTWSVGLDRVDVLLSRPCYQGKRFTLTPSFGLTGLFLDQKYTCKGIVFSQSTGSFDQFGRAYGKTDSWAVGPSLGLEGRFLLGEGFRLVGSLSGALAFTRYNGIRYFAQGFETYTGQQPNRNIRGSDENRVRVIGDAEAGFGWGMYLCNQKYHIDFSATYEFQIFWNQNMLFWFADSLNYNKAGYSPGNLYFQGLTVSGTFDF